MGAVLIILGTLTSLTEAFLTKQYNKKHSKGGFVFTAIVSLFSMLWFVITDSNGFSAPLEIWLYALIGGILFGTSFILTYVALGCGSFGMTTLIISYSVMIPSSFGLVFLGEPISVFTVIGFLLICASLFLFRPVQASSGKKHLISVKWVICVAISTVGSGFIGIISRIQQIQFNDAFTNEFMTICLGISTAALFVAGMATDRQNFTYIIRHGFVWAMLAGLSNGVTNALGLILNTVMPISLSYPMRSGVKILFSFVISVVILREQFEKRQIVGVILGTAALIVLNV